MGNLHIDFSRIDISSVDTLYIEFFQDEFRSLSVGTYAEKKPHEGEVYSDLSEAAVRLAIEKYPRVAHKYLIVNTDEYTVVPKRYFKEEMKESYLDVLLPSLDKGSVVYCDYWAKEELYLVYKAPDFLSSLLKLEGAVECYHLQTSINYVARKKFYAGSEAHIIAYIDDQKIWLIGRASNKAQFVQSYDVRSASDSMYYLLWAWQTFYNLNGMVKFLFLTVDIGKVKEIIDFLRSKHPTFSFNVVDVKRVLQMYHADPTLPCDELFTLLFLSLCA